MNRINISINNLTESLVIFKKIGKCNCMRFFFVGYISTNAICKNKSRTPSVLDIIVTEGDVWREVLQHQLQG